MGLRTASLALLFAACTMDPNHGTAVGNLSATLTVDTLVGKGIEGLDGSTQLRRASVLDCAGGEQVVAEDVELSLVGGTPLPVPAGEACGFRLVPEGVLTWRGVSTSGYALTVELDPGPVEVRPTEPFTIASGERYVWCLGDQVWANAAGLGVDRGDVDIAPGDDRYDALVAEVSERPLLYRDADGDRRPDEDEVVLAGELAWE